MSDSPFPNKEACDNSSQTSNFLLTRFLEGKMQINVRYRIASLVIVCCYNISVVNLFLLYLLQLSFLRSQRMEIMCMLRQLSIFLNVSTGVIFRFIGS